MTIYHLNTNDFLGKMPLEVLLKRLPKSMHARANQYQFEKDAYAFVLGRLLLKRGLEELNLVNEFKQIQISDNGKPFLQNCFFNISHSDKLVVCAVSKESEIGIDVEFIDEVEMSAFEEWFTPQEWKDIYLADDSMRRFYWHWTRKESIIKALGLKLSDLNKLKLDDIQDSFMANGQEWFLRKLDFGNEHQGHLCTKEKVEILFSSLITRDSL